MAKGTIGEVQDRILGGFEKEVKSSKFKRTWKNATEVAIEEGQKAKAKAEAKAKAKKKFDKDGNEILFVAGSAGSSNIDAEEAEKIRLANEEDMATRDEKNKARGKIRLAKKKRLEEEAALKVIEDRKRAEKRNIHHKAVEQIESRKEHKDPFKVVNDKEDEDSLFTGTMPECLKWKGKNAKLAIILKNA